MTRPLAFVSNVRPKEEGHQLNSEELALMEAQKAMFKPRGVPKQVHVPIEGFRGQSTPKVPEQVFKVGPATPAHCTGGRFCVKRTPWPGTLDV